MSSVRGLKELSSVRGLEELPSSDDEESAPEEDDFEYEETPWDSEEDADEEDDEETPVPATPNAATGTLRDGRRFAAFFCSPTIGPLEYLAESQQMIDTGVLSADADLSQGATPEAVDKLMSDFDPHILWFVGHGNAKLAGELTLLWTTASGGFVLIDPRKCCDMLTKHLPQRGGSLECVVLNACETMKDDSTLGSCATRHCTARQAFSRAALTPSHR